MDKKYPIKTDLFRFVTTRTPNQLNQVSTAASFIQHPNIAKSKINSCPLPPKEDDREFEEYLNSFRAVDNYKDIRKINEKLYDVSSVFFRNRNFFPKIETTEIDEYLLTDDQQIAVWDQLFYQVMTSASSYVRQATIQLIITNNIVKNLKLQKEDPEKFQKLLQAKIVIPSLAMSCFKPWIYRECSGSLEGVTNLGIADFRRVEQEVCCYVPGEVSHIENVLAREYKERSSRNLVRSEETIEVTNEIEVENLTDVSTTTRNEISTEIASVLNEVKGSNFGGSVGVSAEYMGAQIDVNAYADFANSNSSSFSNSTSKSYAEEVTKRALERIVQRTKEKRTSTIIKEFEENNKHGFDNRKGDKHVTGIYRWVDIIYKNRLVNYGKRLIMEFMVPEPAEFYKRIQKYKNQSNSTEESEDTATPPKEIKEFGINSPEDIDNENAINAASYYGVNVEEIDTSDKTLTKSLAPPQPISHERYTQSLPLQGIVVDPDYELYKITGSYTFEYRANSWSSSAEAFCDFTFGSKIVSSARHYSANKDTDTVSVNLNYAPGVPGTIPVSVSFSGMFGVYGAVSIKCRLKQSVISDWQNDIYNQLQSAYNQMKSQYESDQAQAQEQASGEQFGQEEQSNPVLNRITEQRELKRACIEMLIKPFCREQGEKLYDDINACDQYEIPQVNQNSKFRDYTAQTKFFEQAFDWDLISYLFYPYYWADKCDWGDLMNSENSDTIFQAFLQAGMARIVVPVREQFNEAVAYYLETGDIWLGGDLVPETDNDLYLSIAEELSEPEGAVEDEWETRVPTTLAIVQDKSAQLDEDGLPCCNVVENEDTTTNINESNTILGNIIPTDPETT